MTIPQLQYFKAVCDYRNFTKAANAMHITQPALSMAIKELERECGVKLFIKDRFNITLSPEGIVFLEYTKRILKEVNDTEELINTYFNGSDFLRIGYSCLTGARILPSVIRKIQENYPNLKPNCFERSDSSELFEMLEKDMLDVVIAVRPVHAEILKTPDSYSISNIMNTTLDFCVSKNSKLASKSFVTLEEISKEPLVLFSDRFSNNRRIKNMFAQKSLPIHIQYYTNQISNIRHYIEEGIAVGFLPHTATGFKKDRIISIPYEGQTVDTLQLFYKIDNRKKELIEEFSAVLKDPEVLTN